MKQPCAVNVYNVVTVAMDSLGRRVSQLGPERMREVCAVPAFALDCGH